jgi:hypothetical protein
MSLIALTGFWAFVFVVGGFVAVMVLVGRFPNQFGMFLWTRNPPPENPDPSESTPPKPDRSRHTLRGRMEYSGAATIQQDDLTIAAHVEAGQQPSTSGGLPGWGGSFTSPMDAMDAFDQARPATLVLPRGTGEIIITLVITTSTTLGERMRGEFIGSGDPPPELRS